jgi:hypothetical protein
MDHHPGGLVEDQEICVLVEHGEGQILRKDLARLGRWDVEGDPVAGPDPGGGPGRAPGERHAPLLEEALRVGAGELGSEPGQREVQADPGELGGDRELSQACYQILDFTCPLDFRITSTMARS